MNRFLLVIWITCLLLPACASRRKEMNEASAQKQLGVAKIGEANPEGALADLTRSYKLNPNDPETVHYLGLAYWSKGRSIDDSTLVVKAEEYLKKSLEMKDEPKWRNNLGALYIDLGRYEDARKECKRALDNPMFRTPERALNNIGKAYIEEARYDEAIAPLDRALRVQPRSCLALWNKGDALKSLRKWDPAIRSLDKVNAICPDYPEPYLIKAQALWYGKNDAAAARKALDQLKALRPDGPLATEADQLIRLMQK